jgi:hypothetical protein
MTCTTQQVKLLMKAKQKFTQEQAAAKAGLSVKTARKYLKQAVTSQCIQNPARKYRTRKDPFGAYKEELESFLIKSPGIQANTLLAHLINKAPTVYNEGHLRSLQRWVKQWSAEQGLDKSVIFCQDLKPGKQSQSDWTHMKSLHIEIGGKPFPHLLFHFMLPYSHWEHVTICYCESLATLTQGYENAVWALGGVLPEHRTDNLSAATQALGSGREFTLRWKEFTDHYGVQPSRNNPGESHENGSVEKSHHLLKTDIDQQLMLRGSRSFATLEEYEKWLQKLMERRNQRRQERLEEELSLLLCLPDRAYHAPIILPLRVNTRSVIMVLGIAYSVPSRLIFFVLKAYVYPDFIDLYYGQKCVQRMTRSYEKAQINYLHIIDSLIRKPGAFEHYQYLEHLFPQPIFRQTYDLLKAAHPSNGHKHYLGILHLAKLYGEQKVLMALQLLVESQQLPLPKTIKALIETAPNPSTHVAVLPPTLADYDHLHSFSGKEVLCH